MVGSSLEVDVFATGVLVYFMLYRALPFWSDNHVEILRKTRECEAGEQLTVVAGVIWGLWQSMVIKQHQTEPTALQHVTFCATCK